MVGVAPWGGLAWVAMLTAIPGLAAALGWVAGRVSSREERRTLQQLAWGDALTGLANRAGMARALSDSASAVGAGEPVAIVVDLDGFKHVNDLYGHAAGDAVLVGTAQRLHGSLADTGLHIVAVARLGGDEFAVVMVAPPGVGMMAAERAAASIHQSLVRPYPVSAEGDRRGAAAQVVVGASIGIAVSAHGERREWSSLLASADRSMYVAKRRGGGWAWARSGQANGVPLAHSVDAAGPAQDGSPTRDRAGAGREVTARAGDRWNLTPGAEGLVA